MMGVIVHPIRVWEVMEAMETACRPILPLNLLKDMMREQPPAIALERLGRAIWLLEGLTEQDVEWACRIIEAGGVCLFVRNFQEVDEVYSWMSEAVDSEPDLLRTLFPVVFSKHIGDQESGGEPDWKIALNL